MQLIEDARRQRRAEGRAQHYFENVGTKAGSIEAYSASPFNRVKLIVGVLDPNIGENGATSRGCSELVRASPSSALIITRSPRDWVGAPSTDSRGPVGHRWAAGLAGCTERTNLSAKPRVMRQGGRTSGGR